MDPDTTPPRLILASESLARRAMLRDAGLDFEARAADFDETAAKAQLAAAGRSPEDIAQVLADGKALGLSRRHPEALVIGGDQILLFEGRIFDKPASRTQARATLRRLSGKRHNLLSAVAVARASTVLWRHRQEAELVMRDLSDPFIDRYLGEIGETATRTVGAYALEGRGAQLFTRVEGDFFTILGLPLLALLGFLREQGVVMT